MATCDAFQRNRVATQVNSRPLHTHTYTHIVSCLKDTKKEVGRAEEKREKNEEKFTLTYFCA